MGSERLGQGALDLMERYADVGHVPRLSPDEVKQLVSEVKERRGADLSDELANDARLLLDNYRTLRNERGGGLYQWEERALAALDKLLAGGKP